MIKYYGDNFRWFLGTVVNINDPLQLGRIQVRIYGIHSDNLLEVPDEDLPWAQVVAAISEGGTNGLGNPLGVQINAQVFGIFLDGKDSQLPLIFGSLPKFEDEEKTVNKLARGENTLTKTVSVDGAPEDPYAAVYPNNKVTQTTSGHVIEIDDTPDGERIHIHHKSGSFVEFHPDGSVVIKTENIYIDAGKNANLKADTINFTGGSGDIIVDGISLVNHTHTDTPGLGSGVTSKPNKG